MYDSYGELTSTPVKDWQSIMVRSGEYKIVVDYVEPAKGTPEEFSLKVFGN